jgi:replication-associated recombination protein RarA
MPPQPVIVLDGANIAYTDKTRKGKPRVSNLIKAIKELTERGFKTITIVDAALRHEIDDDEQFESLIDKGLVLQAPAGTEADYFILTTARQEEAHVLSNDLFSEFKDEFASEVGRRVPFMIVEGEVQLYEDQLP